MSTFQHAFVVRAPLDAVWGFHSDPSNLEKITPPPAVFRVLRADRPLREGSRITLRLNLGPVATTVSLRVVDVRPNVSFTDEQIEAGGPFRRWRHTHAFEPVAEGTRVIDRIEYEPPFGVFGRAADALFGRLAMGAQFAARRRATRRLLESG